ncbi:DEKNAAC100758 [Brettanomyces naardenensis]|uniref:DEKNAAC100758 n=1 Tax=Brettanomyces naardenensis TaxID=13370 RepID=A0A448YEX9_BRENA|nr:DEKNAAC100758 [Brettanomyces naardenensis]
MSTKTTTKSSTVIPDKVAPATSRGYKMKERGAQNISFGNATPYPIPQFEDPYLKREWMLEHMAGAFRVFGRRGFGEGSAGHISIRDPVNPKTFWINPLGVHFSLIKASDMIQVDGDGNIIGGNTRGTINAAGFAIHSAVHRARPDVNAACHTHSVFGKAYSCFGKPLEMLSQDSCIFYKNQAVYTDFGGVAVEKAEGEKIAKASGNVQAIILQNHGLLTAGSTVDEAAYIFTLMERTCQCQLLADAAEHEGRKKVIIGDEEAAYTNFIDCDPESLYLEFAVDLSYEIAKDDSFMTFTKAREAKAKKEKEANEA